MATLKFRVLLDSDKNEEVFRDILIREEDNFENFYFAILKSFNFEGKEIGSFFMSNDEWDKGHEISLMDMRFSDEEDGLPSVMKETKISEMIEVTDQKIILVYDFMRMWIFLIELIGTENTVIDAPSVAMSIGLAPPEDSKMMEDNSFLEDESFGEDEFDEFGEDYEDGYDSDDFGGYEEFEY